MTNTYFFRNWTIPIAWLISASIKFRMVDWNFKIMNKMCSNFDFPLREMLYSSNSTLFSFAFFGCVSFCLSLCTISKLYYKLTLCSENSLGLSDKNENLSLMFWKTNIFESYFFENLKKSWFSDATNVNNQESLPKITKQRCHCRWSWKFYHYFSDKLLVRRGELLKFFKWASRMGRMKWSLHTQLRLQFC